MWIQCVILLVFVIILLLYKKVSPFQDISLASWAIVQFDDRPLEQFQKLIDINKAYADKYGYDHILITKSEKGLPAYWEKVRLVKEILPNYSAVLWLDTDAVIVDSKRELDEFMPPGIHFSASSDTHEALTSGPFNAGVWFVRNSVEGNQIMKEWYDSYDPDAWECKVEGWKTHARWAGPQYEQGAFVNKILTNPRWKRFIKMYPWRILQANKQYDETFIMHFMGTLKSEIPYFRIKSKS